MSNELSHVDESSGAVQMVDVGHKPPMRRVAVARGAVLMAPETSRRLRDLPKGDALTTAQLAGIMGGKATSTLIPLCHPLPLSSIDVELAVGDGRVDITATAKVTGQTGVEMEALTAVAVAGLTVYDMAKAIDKSDDDHRDHARREDEGSDVRAGVLTVSDRVSRGEADDVSGDTLEELLLADGFEVIRRLVPDERDEIARAIADLAADANLVLTTGGTGLAARDVTPEATRSVLEREAPGIAEAIRADSIAKTPHGLLMRGARRNDRRRARRQPRRLARRLPRRLRRAAAGASPRPEAVGRPGNSNRPHPYMSDTAYTPVGTARLFARLIKVEHTIFALPFAYVGALLAANAVPSGHDLLWITVAMVGARSLAMALNRLIDAGIDARNPRTAGREIPSGKLSIVAVLVFCLASLLVFLVAVWQLNPVVRWLWPIPVVGVRDLPVPQALHVDLPPLARRGRRPRARRRLGRDHREAPLAGVGARRRGRHLGRGVRPLLLALRRRDRPRAGAPLVGDALRRARRVRRARG